MNFTIRFTRRWVIAVGVVGAAVLMALFMTGAAQTLIEHADKGPLPAAVAPTSGVGAAVRASVGTGQKSFIGLGLIGIYVFAMFVLITVWASVRRPAHRGRARQTTPRVAITTSARATRAKGGAKPLPVQRF